MKTEYQCACGETEPLNYYNYRTYECKKCLRGRVAKGSPKPPKCKCGASDPSLFYKNRRSKCKSCVLQSATKKYHTDPEYRASRYQSARRTMLSNLFKYRCDGASNRAKKYGIDFDISEAFLRELHTLQGGMCHYSGISFIDDSEYYTWSIDRVDNTKGYTKDNIVLVCAIVNSMKNDLSLNEFSDIISNLYCNLIQRNSTQTVIYDYPKWV